MFDSESTNCRKLYQTKISSFLSGCVKTLPTENKLIKKRRSNKKVCRRMSFSSNASMESSASNSILSLHAISLTNLSLEGVSNRKLPAPIFSDDEGGNENNVRNLNLGNQKDGISISVKEPKILLALNRPAPIDITKTCNRIPLSASTNSSANPNLNPEIPKSSASIVTSPEASCSTAALCDEGNKDLPKGSPTKTIQVLENVVISPKKSPPKKLKVVADDFTLKKEFKKINYEQLKVFREFFISILKNNHLHLSNLLSKTDRELLFKFFNSEKNHQYVCIKLFMWKHIWYNIFKYVEKIGLEMSDNDVVVMYNYLREQRFVDTDYMSEDTFQLLTLLNLKDTRDIARSFRLTNIQGTKEHLITRLLNLCKTQITLTSVKNIEDVLRESIQKHMGFCVKLSSDLNRCLYYLYLLNTFTNPSLTDPQDYFTNVSYFSMVFPTYKVENFHIFYTPQEFSKFAEAMTMVSELDKAVEKRNSLQIFEICQSAFEMLKKLDDGSGSTFDDSRPPHLERFTHNHQYIRIITSGSKHITTTYYNDVKKWFEYLISQKRCAYKRAQWYCHLALIYNVYLKDYTQAAKLVITAFKEEKEHLSDIDQHELRHRGLILNRKTYNLPKLFHDQIADLSPPSCDRNWPQDIIDCKSLQSQEPGRKRVYVHRFENGDVNYLTVEQTALGYYRKSGYPNGLHCEGSVIEASFCLLFWDIIYNEYVEGTFCSELQTAPLDMYTKYFYLHREKSIKKRLAHIKEKWKEEEFQEKLLDSWNLHSHESSLCAIDSVVDRVEDLYNIITCIGRPILSKIFERLVKNYKLYHSGFPDLIVWNVKEKKAKFVEVKSENDKLSIKQKLWLNYLLDVGASAAVCHVEPKASKKKLHSPKKEIRK